MKKERVLYLDLLRVVCFLLIAAYHLEQMMWEYQITSNAAVYAQYPSGYFGPAAMLCLFMVAGAVMTCQYREEITLRTYYKKAFLSIFPLFWLSYFFAFLDYFYVNKAVPQAPKQNFLLTILGMDGYLNGITDTFYLIGEWFLGALILLLVLYPLYRAIMNRCIYLLPLIFGIGSVCLLGLKLSQRAAGENMIYCSFFFTLGMLLQQLQMGQNEKLTLLFRRIYGAIGLIGIIFLMTSHHLENQIGTHYVNAMMAIFLYLFFMELAELIRHDRVKRLLITVSRYSFAFFLIHHVFMSRYVSHFAGTVLSGTSTLTLLISVVFLSYVLAVLLVKLMRRR